MQPEILHSLPLIDFHWIGFNIVWWKWIQYHLCSVLENKKRPRTSNEFVRLFLRGAWSHSTEADDVVQMGDLFPKENSMERISSYSGHIMIKMDTAAQSSCNDSDKEPYLWLINDIGAQAAEFSGDSQYRNERFSWDVMLRRPENLPFCRAAEKCCQNQDWIL